METLHVSTWSDFTSEIAKLRARYEQYREELPGGTVAEGPVRLLFRGQSDASWRIETTLERRSKERFSLVRYVLRATRGVNEIESFTGRQWKIPKYPDLLEEISNQPSILHVRLPCYDYLVYLRHHGYPSPLLDWTESPYIAAFFAYWSPAETDRAIYCYIERPKLVKGGREGSPLITVQGPFVSTDKRHFAQKAWYTIATRFEEEGGTKQHFFCPHESIFQDGAGDQDLLFKLVLPANLRSEVVRHLGDYNINAFTLFQSEDSLVKAIETKDFDL